MKEKKKTGAWIRLIVFSFLALILITILISGIRKGGMGIPFLSFSSFQYANEEKYTVGDNSITASQLKDIDINWVSGSITLEAYDGDTIEITETSDSDISSDDRVRSCYENGVLTIQFRKSTFLLFGTQASGKNLKIRIPKTLAEGIENLSLDSVSSENSITGLSVKHCDIDTVSGDLTFDGTLQNLELDTVSGKCLISSQKAPDNIEADSVSGDVTLKIPGDSGFTAEQDGVSSNFNSEFPTSLTDDNYVCGNGGTGKWEFDSVSGDVRIEKLN